MQVMYIILLALSNTVINVPNPINPMNGPSALLLGAFNNYVDKKREGGGRISVESPLLVT